MNMLIADDHPMTLLGTKTFVESLGHTVIEIANNGIMAYNGIAKHKPQVAVLDISMPGITGLEILEKVVQHNLPTKVVLLTMHQELELYRKAQSLGVHGYILKEHAQEELAACLAAIDKGKKYLGLALQKALGISPTDALSSSTNLSYAEKKVIELIKQQKTSAQIADLLFISERTVEKHRQNIIEKLGLPKEKNSLLIWALSQKN